MKDSCKNKIKKSYKYKQYLTKVFELPAEAVTGDFRFICVGRNDVYLENHQGILHYTQKKLVVKTSKKNIVFMGNNIYIKKMGRKNLIVQGEIDLIEFVDS